MKKLSSFARTVLVVGIVLLAISAPASASPPEEVVITFDLVITVPGSAAEGTFVATGAMEDSGTVDETFRWTDDGNLQGTMVLTGAEGTITLRFQLGDAGQFVIKSGTGAYENIHGVGTVEASTDVTVWPFTIDATFAGTVHIDP